MTRPYETRPTPARVSAEAAASFPRLALWGLWLAYLLAGLFTRAPWPQDDAAGFGVMSTMAQALTHADAAAWWLPSVAGVYVVDEGPLAFWVGALMQYLCAPLLDAVSASRLTCLAWFALSGFSLWHATRRLARREEALPIAFVFGGEASTHAYGRMLADIAVLLLIGTVGIALRLHETSAETAALAWACASVFGLALALDRPLAGGLVSGVFMGFWILTRGTTHAPFVLLAMLTAFALLPLPRSHRVWVALAFVISAGAVSAAWPLAAFAYAPQAAARYFDLWATAWEASLTLPTWNTLSWLARNMVWYTWPLWPLAAWTLYSWRHALRAPHVRVPLVLTVGALAATAFSASPSDSGLMLLIPPLAILAAFGATTLRRSADDSIDWMAIVLFSLLSAVAWTYYLAMQTGAPIKMAASVARLTPGFAAHFEPLAVAWAAMATSIWLGLVAWRLLRRPPVLWRGPLLAASGTVMVWTVLASLFMPAIDYNRNYAPLAQHIAAEGEVLGGPEACFMPHRLTPAHLALFSHFGGVRFARVEQGEVCNLALHRDSRRTLLDDDPPPGHWQPVWEGGWPARPDETLRIYKRLGR